MKKIFFTFSLIAAYSCSDFTDAGLPADQITRDLVFRDESLANAAMAGIYRSTEQNGFLSGSYSGANLYMGCYTDELVSFENSSSDLSQFFLLSHHADSSFISSLWLTTYSQIYNINSVIEGLENSELLSDSFKNKMLGEALVIRSALYLYLTNTFGDIPFTITTSYAENSIVKRESQLSVYGKIRQDLEKAVPLLPETAPKGNRVRPTRMAAYALLARLAYLQHRWEDAAHYCTIVIQHPSYAMEQDLDRVFVKESSSAIWQMLPYDSTYNTMEGNLFVLLQAPPSSVALAPSFMEGFETADQRKIHWTGEISDDQNTSYFYPFKYKESSFTAESLEYSILLRVEELYLIRAEAYINKEQPDEGAQDLNAIRRRAGLPDISTRNKELLLNAVLQERKYELFTEFGHRFEDLKHSGMLDQQMSLIKPAWKNHYKWWPLPENELLLNPNLYPQNDGY